MTEKEQHLKQLEEIKTIMQRSSRFLSLSGLSGVSAGFFALAGALAFYMYANKNHSNGYLGLVDRISVDTSMSFVSFCFIDAIIVLVLSLTFGIYFTTRRAKAEGQKIWDPAAVKLLINLAIPLATGGIFCLILLYQYGFFGLVAPCTLIFYGLALLNASKYTLDEIRWLGISEIALGLIGCMYLGFGITLWAIGFGILHIIYGLLMYVRYEAKPQERKYW